MSETIDENFKAGNVLNGLDLSISIYKFVPLKYIMPLLGGQLFVNKIESWDDVYENFLLKQHFTLEDGTSIKADNLIKCNFGQSWTKSEETDAMWRIYSDVSECKELLKCCRPSSLVCSDPFACTDPFARCVFKDVAVRIKTTAKKLFDSIYTDNICMSNTYIGVVEYLSKVEYDKWLSSVDLSENKLQDIFVESLFIKRNEFAHEDEVRIVVFLSEDDHRVNESMLYYYIDPKDFIEEILIDPRLKSSEFSKIIKDMFISKGIDGEKIVDSSLYDFQPHHSPLILR